MNSVKIIGLILILSGLIPGVTDAVAHVASVFGYVITPPIRLPAWAHIGYVLVALTGCGLRYPEETANAWANLATLVRGARNTGGKD